MDRIFRLQLYIAYSLAANKTRRSEEVRLNEETIMEQIMCCNDLQGDREGLPVEKDAAWMYHERDFDTDCIEQVYICGIIRKISSESGR
jgi:hypothetical protein